MTRISEGDRGPRALDAFYERLVPAALKQGDSADGQPSSAAAVLGVPKGVSYQDRELALAHALVSRAGSRIPGSIRLAQTGRPEPQDLDLSAVGLKLANKAAEKSDPLMARVAAISYIEGVNGTDLVGQGDKVKAIIDLARRMDPLYVTAFADALGRSVTRGDIENYVSRLMPGDPTIPRVVGNMSSVPSAMSVWTEMSKRLLTPEAVQFAAGVFLAQGFPKGKDGIEVMAQAVGLFIRSGNVQNSMAAKDRLMEIQSSQPERLATRESRAEVLAELMGSFR
jgi:hypothetical protein